MSSSWNPAKLLVVLVMVTIAVCCGRGRNGGSSDSDLAAIDASGTAALEGMLLDGADRNTAATRIYRWRSSTP